MKIFVTGAAGQVGSVVTRELVRCGHEVTGLVRTPTRAHNVEEAGAKVVLGNLFDPPSWSYELRAAEVLLSLSRPLRVGKPMSIKESHRRSYNHGKMIGNLLSEAQGSNIRCALLTYGVQAFGDRQDKWLDAQTELDPVGYERSVAGAFWHIDKTSRKTRIPINNIFVGWSYGPGGWFESLAREVKAGTHRIIGDGSNYLSLIHIDDLAAAYGRLVDKMPIGKRYALVDGSPLTQKEIVERVAELTGGPDLKFTSMERAADRMGELMAESWAASVRVSGDQMKRELLPELAYPDFESGSAQAIEALCLMSGDEVEHDRAASGF
jgi:nucleoside-diphosphate-sugar epimerase